MVPMTRDEKRLNMIKTLGDQLGCIPFLRDTESYRISKTEELETKEIEIEE